MSDLDACLDHLRAHAASQSKGQCARYVRLALAAGGLSATSWPPVAKDYGPYLTRLGFNPLDVDPATYTPARGDVVVLDGLTAGQAGHVSMWDGAHWVSDFVQRDVWAGPAFREQRPAAIAFRWPIAEGKQ